MRVPKLILGYGKYNDATLDVKAQAIIGALTNNPNFQETVPTLVNFTTVATTYANALTAASSRDKVAVSEKNEARKKLVEIMRLLALNIESQAEGSRTKLVSSGFELGADGESSTITAPQGFLLEEGMNPGEVRFSVKAMAGAKSYLFEYTEEPLTAESTWVSKVSSKREYLFTNLRSGMRIYGRVTVIGTRGQEATSAVLSRLVQ